ncbi:MAG: hypothetical protein MJ182_11020 [Treponema sp.]|nr:hypothetical protein [Treponema sp.]
MKKVLFYHQKGFSLKFTEIAYLLFFGLSFSGIINAIQIKPSCTFIRN